MIRRISAVLCIAFLFAAGCATRTSQPAAPDLADADTLEASDGTALTEAGRGLRSVRIYVDVVPVLDTRDGVPVINTAHGTDAGRAAVSALHEAFSSHGFRVAQGEFTSIGLGAPPRNILLTSGSEAPVLSTLPVLVAQGLAGTDRGAWIGSLFASVRSLASGEAAPATLAAAYLSPNLDRIEVFAVLTGGEGSRASIRVAAFDSRNGRVLWSASASEAAAVLDSAVATSLVRRLAGALPSLPRQGG